MIYRYAEIKDLDEIMGLYKEASLNEWCTWDDSYPDTGICKKDIETESLLCLEDNGTIIAAISFDSDDIVDNLELWNKKYRNKARELARLVVKDSYRNQGIAAKMILKAMTVLKNRGYKAVHYLVSPDNLRAVNSYAKLGFTKAGECELYGHRWHAYEKDLYYIERSITGEFKRTLWNPFVEAIEKYKLIKDGDRIAVCISGGKDSMLLARMLKMAKDYRLYDFSLEYIMMNPGYMERDMKQMEFNNMVFDIPVSYFNTNLFDDVEEIGKNPCFFCSRMRRGHLYRKAKELGCNKIALGHHYDDVIETTLMSMLYGAQARTMLPVIKSDNIEDMKLIRPMYLIREDDINLWKNRNNLNFVKCACRLNTKDGGEDTMRLRIKKLIRDLTNENPAVPANIFGSMSGIDLEHVLSYKIDGVTHSILDDM